MKALRQFRGVLMFGILLCCLSVRATDKTLLCFSETDMFTTSALNGSIEDIDTNVCTHLVYGRIILDIETNEISEISEVLNNLKATNGGLKTRNPNLKILISLSLKQSSWDITQMKLMENSSNVEAMAGNIVEFLKNNTHDGVVFQYQPYGREQIGFLNLLNATKKAFNPHKYLVVFSYKLHPDIHHKGYNFPSLKEGFDFVVLDTFNFHDSQTEWWQAAQHVPLYNQYWDNKNRSVDSVVSRWIKNGVPTAKLLLGIPLWGQTWKLTSNVTSPPADARGGGLPGKYTNESGILGYFEICQDVKKNGWQVIQDQNKTMGPYAVSPADPNQERVWISYDDPDMVTTKSKYILSKELGGAAVKDISYDDNFNQCGEGRNPMLTAIRKTLTPEWTRSSATTLNFSCFLFIIIPLMFLSLFNLVYAM